MPMTPFQQRLDKLRNAAGLSMRELSVRAGLNETAVKAIMSGRSESPRGKTLNALASALGVSTADLLGDEASPSPPFDSPPRPVRSTNPVPPGTPVPTVPVPQVALAGLIIGAAKLLSGH